MATKYREKTMQDFTKVIEQMLPEGFVLEEPDKAAYALLEAGHVVWSHSEGGLVLTGDETSVWDILDHCRDIELGMV